MTAKDIGNLGHADPVFVGKLAPHGTTQVAMTHLRYLGVGQLRVPVPFTLTGPPTTVPIGHVGGMVTLVEVVRPHA